MLATKKVYLATGRQTQWAARERARFVERERKRARERETQSPRVCLCGASDCGLCFCYVASASAVWLWLAHSWAAYPTLKEAESKRERKRAQECKWEMVRKKKSGKVSGRGRATERAVLKARAVKWNFNSSKIKFKWSLCILQSG